MIMALGPYASFIVMSYAMVATVVAVLIIWVIADYRRQMARLRDLEAEARNHLADYQIALAELNAIVGIGDAPRRRSGRFSDSGVWRSCFRHRRFRRRLAVRVSGHRNPIPTFRNMIVKFCCMKKP